MATEVQLLFDNKIEGLDELRQLCCGLTPLEGSTTQTPRREHPLIVVEGLDGSGKSTLVKSLAAALGGVVMVTPPPELRALRTVFDGQVSELRRAFYSTANYLAGQQVLAECRTRPVIMDRFWHSTSAYALASANTVLPPMGDPVYRWPHDLIVPDAVLLLGISEEKRGERLRGRLRKMGGEMTWEEERLSKDLALTRRIMEAFRRMEPKMREVNGNLSKQRTFSAAQRALRKRSDLITH